MCEGFAEVVRSGSSRGVEYALLTLNSLCCYSEDMSVEARREGALDLCMGLLEDDNEKIRRNAWGLIQVLRGSQSIQ